MIGQGPMSGQGPNGMIGQGPKDREGSHDWAGQHYKADLPWPFIMLLMQVKQHDIA